MYFLNLTVSENFFLKDISVHYSNFINPYQKSFSGFMIFDTSNVSIVNDSLIFHSIFPVFRTKKFSKRLLSCFFDSFSEIKFGYISRKEKNLFFLGKIFKRKNNLTLFPIKNFKKPESIQSNFKNHLKNPTYLYKNENTGERENFIKEKKFISFFKNFSRISVGNRDHLFNVKFIFKPKTFNFYRKISGRKNLTNDFDLKKIGRLLEKLFTFSLKSMEQRFNFLFCDYIGDKNYLKKAFFFFFFLIWLFYK